MSMGLKVGKSPKLVFLIQSALYLITLFPFMIGDLILRQQIYNYQAILTVDDMDYVLMLTCLFLTQNGIDNLHLWLTVDGFTKLAFFCLLLIFTGIIVGVRMDQAKKIQKGFSTFTFVFLLFQLAWGINGTILLLTVINPANNMNELFGIKVCNDQIEDIMEGVGRVGLILIVLSMIGSCLRPKQQEKQEDMPLSAEHLEK